MLNKPLYTALVKLLGDVDIVSVDDPGQYSIPHIPSGYAKGKLARILADMINWGECYSFRCPICRDHSKRAFIGHRLGTSIPYGKGSKRAHFSWHLAKCHNEECQSKPAFRDMIKNLDLPLDYEYSSIAQTITPKVIDLHEVLQHEVPLPVPCYMINDDNVPLEVREYLLNRGFDLEYLAREFNIRYSPAKALTGWDNDDTTPNELFDQRIIIPQVQHMNQCGWQGRTIKEGEKRFKYLNSKGAKKSQWVYNLDKALMYPEVMIFEGVTNVWRTGVDSIAIFGKALSQYQAQLIKTVWDYDGTGVLCYDEDTYQGNVDMHTAKLLHGMGAFANGLSVLRLRNGDAAKHTMARMRQLKGMATDLAKADTSIVQVLDEHDVAPYNGEELRMPRVCTKVVDKLVITLPDEDDEDDYYDREDVF